MQVNLKGRGSCHVEGKSTFRTRRFGSGECNVYQQLIPPLLKALQYPKEIFFFNRENKNEEIKAKCFNVTQNSCKYTREWQSIIISRLGRRSVACTGQYSCGHGSLAQVGSSQTTVSFQDGLHAKVKSGNGIKCIVIRIRNWMLNVTCACKSCRLKLRIHQIIGLFPACTLACFLDSISGLPQKNRTNLATHTKPTIFYNLSGSKTSCKGQHWGMQHKWRTINCMIFRSLHYFLQHNTYKPKKKSKAQRSTINCQLVKRGRQIFFYVWLKKTVT